MLLYEDIITGDEMFSDAFPVKVIDDIVYEVDCSMIVVKEGDVDIGANPGSGGGRQQVNNVAHSFRLQSTTFDKKSFLTYLKGYMKAVKAKLAESKPDRYTGEAMNPDGMVALLNYREDGVTPYFTFWKDGLKEIKL
ncbi:Mss4-like protein [Mycena leptocephala]|nr:Mss4-like protein [Mycena leptocephala]